MTKRHLVKDFLTSTRANIVCLQESKLQELHRSMWRSIGGGLLDSFEYIPASGSAGGIIMAWDNSQVSGSLKHVGSFSLTIEFTNRVDNSVWLCTTVYGPNARSLKSDFWNEIRFVRRLCPAPWVICGDFNTVFSPKDKNKGFPNLGELAASQSLIEELNLLDPPLHGRGYTWTNGQTDPLWIRLDRFLLSHTWPSIYPRTCQYALPRFGSDHSPICIEFGAHLSQPRNFRFEKSWYSNEHLGALIQDWWTEINPEGCGAFILSKRLINLKIKLRRWASETFGSVKMHKKALLLELSSLDSNSENRPLSDTESQRISQLQLELYSLLKQDKIYWKQ